MMLFELKAGVANVFLKGLIENRLSVQMMCCSLPVWVLLGGLLLL